MKADPDIRGLEHPALFYRGEQEYLAGTMPFIRQGVEEGAPVLVAVAGRNLEALLFPRAAAQE